MSRVPFIFLIVFAIVFLETGNSQFTPCGSNEEITLCGTACPPTCSSPQPQVCTQSCKIGCQCKLGYLLNSSGECILPSDC